MNQLNRLKLLLSAAPIGKHPDEEADGKIHNPDGTVVEPVIKPAEGFSGMNDPEPVLQEDVPAVSKMN